MIPLRSSILFLLVRVIILTLILEDECIYLNLHFSFSKICIDFKLLKRRWKACVVRDLSSQVHRDALFTIWCICFSIVRFFKTDNGGQGSSKESMAVKCTRIYLNLI